MAAVARQVPPSARFFLLVAIIVGCVLGIGLVALGTYGVVNDWEDSTAESTRTIAIVAAAAIVAGAVLYRIGRRGIELSAASTAMRAGAVGALAVAAGIALFWSGLWGPLGAVALVLGLFATPRVGGRNRVFALGGTLLGAAGFVFGIGLSLFA